MKVVSAASLLVICGYCRATLLRRDVDVERIGTMAALLDDRSPLQVGAEGRWRSTGFGVLGLLGFMAFVGGGYYLFDTPAGQIEMRVSIPLLLGSAVASAGLIFFVLGAALKARERPTATGAEQLLAEQGTVIDWSGDRGNIRIRGEVWAARAARPFAPGDAVRVKDRDGLVLVVEPV